MNLYAHTRIMCCRAIRYRAVFSGAASLLTPTVTMERVCTTAERPTVDYSVMFFPFFFMLALFRYI